MKFVHFLLPSDAAFSPPVAERKKGIWQLGILPTGGLIYIEYCTHFKYVTMIKELTALKFLKVLSSELDPAQIGLIH